MYILYLPYLAIWHAAYAIKQLVRLPALACVLAVIASSVLTTVVMSIPGDPFQAGQSGLGQQASSISSTHF